MIAGSSASGAGTAVPASGAGASLAGLRLDRINSREVLRLARHIYFCFLESCPGAAEPIGVVLVGETDQGRVVFDVPVLLPDEQFIPFELLRARAARTRSGRTPSRGGGAGSAAAPAAPPAGFPPSR